MSSALLQNIIQKLTKDGQATSRTLTRIESKLVRGFEELGISTDKREDWLTVDNDARIVYVDTIGRSLMVLLSEMQRHGATHYGENYEIVHKGETIALVELRKLI